MRTNRFILLLSASVIATALVTAEDWELPLDEPQLKPGPRVEVVSANCQVCHSVDYISTQPPLNRVAWTATVQKMREKYGALLTTNQVDEVVDYLVRNYGKK